MDNKDRDYFIGHSIKANTGRWQTYRDIFWYMHAKTDDDKSSHEAEMTVIKQQEKERFLIVSKSC